jgi:hypothetical protein
MQNLLIEHMQNESRKTLVVVIWFESFHMFVNQVCGVDIFPFIMKSCFLTSDRMAKCL